MKIELRYDYDTAGFFEKNPEAKKVMRAAADFYESLIDARLAAINPAAAGRSWTAVGFSPSDPYSGAQIQIPNLVVPENTIVIFVAAADLGGPGGIGGPGGFNPGPGSTADWFSLLSTRGKSGALAAKPTEFGTWGGCISISRTGNWNFSLTRNSQGQIPMLSVAVHEIAHVLGIGSSGSWNAQHDGEFFRGAHAMNAFGGPVPLDTNDPSRAHWRFNRQCVLPHGHSNSNPDNVLSRAFGGFGTPHGFDQIALMDPQFCAVGPFLKVITDLDIAALRDIGWEIRPQRELFVDGKGNDGPPVRLGWQSNSLFEYQIERNDSLRADGWKPMLAVPGNGGVMTHEPDITVNSQGFFRLRVLPRVVETALDEPAPAPARATLIDMAGSPPVMVSCRFCQTEPDTH